jgi:purine-binding chemotaxis protein CheW
MNTDAILRERARLLAQPLEDESAREGLEIIVFRVGSERFAFESSQVREVFTAREITPLPGTPPWVAGILNVRGRILSVLHVGILLGAEAEHDAATNCLLILRGDEIEGASDVALLTGALEGISLLPANALEPPHALAGAPGARYRRGLTSEGITLLDAAPLLGDSQLLVQDE